jgi:hypothetical protein
VRHLLTAALVVACASPGAAQQLATVRVPVPSLASVDSVRRLGVDVVEVHLGPGRAGGATLTAVVSPRDRAALLSHGYRAVEALRPPLLAAQESRRQLFGAAAYTVFRDFDDPVRGVAAFLRSLAATRPNVFLDTAGTSVEGRPILAVKVGTPDDSPARPNVLFMATYHAREWVATEMALRLLVYLADSLPRTAAGAALLASRDIWVMPVVNPDGYEYTFTGDRLWRKNRRPNPGGSLGVDLNRNHAAFFAFDDVGSSADPTSETYRGASAESEPETRAVVAFHRAHPPAVSASYHSYTGAIFYPWTHQEGELPPDEPVFRALAGTDVAPAVPDSLPGSTKRYYHPGPGWQLYPTNGDYVEWAYRALGTIAFTVELTSGCCSGGAPYGFEFPDDEAMVERVVQDNRPFALALIGAAGDVAHATGPSGLAVPPAALGAVWPLFSANVAHGVTGVVDVLTMSRLRGTAALSPDSLGAGTAFDRVGSADALLDDPLAVRALNAGLEAEVLARDGAESPESPWRGFTRVSGGFEGAWSWEGYADTLVSPPIPLAGRTGVGLFFWQRHAGSAFDQTRRGVVQVSGDSGRTWTDVYRAVGLGSSWYPVAVTLPVPAGAGELMLRFIADSLDWRVDAIAVTSAVTQLFDVAASPTGALEVSANPVRSAPVVMRWPPGSGSARVELYAMTGSLITSETIGPDVGRWAWPLTTRSGEPVVNGVYVVVVTRSDGTRLRRRLFVARRSP